MDNLTANVPQDVTSDDKLLALLSHLSILFGGLLIPFIIWITQKDKSKFVRFHALQAIFYHLAFSVLLVAFIFFMLFVMLLSGAGLGLFDAQEYAKDSGAPVVFIIITIATYILIFVVAIGGIAYGIYLGVKAYQGKLIKVPVIGKMVYRKVYE